MQLTFGDRLRQARTARRWTLKQFGDRMGVSTAAVSAWENNATVPCFTNLAKLVAVLDVSADELIMGSEGARTAGQADSTHVRDMDEARLLNHFRRLRRNEQATVLQFLAIDFSRGTADESNPGA